MTESTPERHARVSIILPIHNREAFLAEALSSIVNQTFTDWELIVVDDGSADGSVEEVLRHTEKWTHHVRLQRQINRGAYSARNAGIALAQGRFLAFFDSDDIWLSHHLEDCVSSLEANPEVDWVYGACRIVDQATQLTTMDSTFHPPGQTRPFLLLKTIRAGRLLIIDDPSTLEVAMLHGLYCGLQCSVVRSEIFRRVGHFSVNPRNESEDQVFVVRAITQKCRFGYLDQIHAVYRVHNQNSSAAGVVLEPTRTVRVLRELIAGYEQLPLQVCLDRQDFKSLKMRLSREYFWHLGCLLEGPMGLRGEAIQAYWKGISLWPWNIYYWKTYMCARIRLIVDKSSSHAPVIASKLDSTIRG